MIKWIVLFLVIHPLQAGVIGTPSLSLSGSVPITLDISITPEAVASNLDLHTTQSGLLVATVFESSNSQAGYRVKAKSANGGKIKNLSFGVSYTFSYDGLSGAFPSPNSEVIVKTQNTPGLFTSIPSQFRISYTGVMASHLAQGNYSDTVTFILENL